MGRFRSYPPTPEQEASLEAFRVGFQELAFVIQANVPTEGRYLSLALTALEEAAMWASKAVTH